MPAADDSTVDGEYKRGLGSRAAATYFEAHEAFEARVARVRRRTSATSSRGSCTSSSSPTRRPRQAGRRGAPAEKALRRLGPYAPAHRGLDVARLLAALERAEADLREQLVERDPEPPVAVEEEQQPERDQRRRLRRPGSAGSASRTQRNARIACANATPGEHERGAEPERVGEQQDDAAARRRRSSCASTRIEASTVPMHGAAQTANAPPSSAPEPLRRAPLQQARARRRARATAAGR